MAIPREGINDTRTMRRPTPVSKGGFAEDRPSTLAQREVADAAKLGRKDAWCRCGKLEFTAPWTGYELLALAPRELWIVYALKVLESYSYYSMSYILLLYLTEEFGMSDLEAGLCYGIMGALISIYGFLVGFAIDNMGVKKSLSIGNVILLAARLVLALTASKIAVFFTLFTILPLGTAFGIPVLQIAVRRYTFLSYSDGRPGNSKVAFSVFYIMMNVAAAIAAPAVDVFRNTFKSKVIMYHGAL